MSSKKLENNIKKYIQYIQKIKTVGKLLNISESCVIVFFVFNPWATQPVMLHFGTVQTDMFL